MKRSLSGCRREEAALRRQDQGHPAEAVSGEKTELVYRCDGTHGMVGCDVQGSVPRPERLPIPAYDPMTVVSIRLTADELEAILTKT